MDHRSRIAEIAHTLADAISRRDVATIRKILAMDFLLRSPGRSAVGAEEFVANIQQIPGEIVYVRLESLEVDVAGSTALVTGIQRAQVRVEGNALDDVRPFVDWFVQTAQGEWQIKVAVDLPPVEAGARDTT